MQQSIPAPEGQRRQALIDGYLAALPPVQRDMIEQHDKAVLWRPSTDATPAPVAALSKGRSVITASRVLKEARTALTPSSVINSVVDTIQKNSPFATEYVTSWPQLCLSHTSSPTLLCSQRQPFFGPPATPKRAAFESSLLESAFDNLDQDPAVTANTSIMVAASSSVLRKNLHEYASARRILQPCLTLLRL